MPKDETATDFAEAFQRWCLRNNVDPSSKSFVSSLSVTIANYHRERSSGCGDSLIKSSECYRD